MANKDFKVEIDQKEFLDALDALKKANDSIDDKWIKSTMRRKAKPIESDMKRWSPSSRMPEMIGITTAKKKTRGGMMKVGVVKNDPSQFPKMSSYGTAAVLEYGTDERYRQAKKFGIVTGRIPTGKIPQRRYAWLRQSWDRNVKTFEEDVEQTAIKRVERAIE